MKVKVKVKVGKVKTKKKTESESGKCSYVRGDLYTKTPRGKSNN